MGLTDYPEVASRVAQFQVTGRREVIPDSHVSKILHR